MRATQTWKRLHPACDSVPASSKPVALTHLDHNRVAERQIAGAWDVCDGLSP